MPLYSRSVAVSLSSAAIHLTICTPPDSSKEASPNHLRASRSLVVDWSRFPDSPLFSRSAANVLIHGATIAVGSPATSAPSNERPCHIHFTLLPMSVRAQTSRFLDGAACGSLINLAYRRPMN